MVNGICNNIKTSYVCLVFSVKCRSHSFFINCSSPVFKAFTSDLIFNSINSVDCLHYDALVWFVLVQTSTLFILQCCDAVGWAAEKGIRPVKTWAVRCWRGYLSGVRCKWFAYGPADTTVTPSSLVAVKSRMVYLSGAGLPRLSWKKGC